ncbi:MAG: DNA topology modulation protein [Saprospiraceae bacterium]
MQRVLIIGCGGAGKSTLAKKIAKSTNLPLIHLDQHYWRPNWVEPSSKTWYKQVAGLIKLDAWIMDGNYGGTMDQRIVLADTIIFMDYPTWRCLFRVLKRTIIYWRRSRPDMTEGCPERFSWDFLHYIATYNQTRKPKILAKLSGLEADKNIHILQNDQQVNHFLNLINDPNENH